MSAEVLKEIVARATEDELFRKLLFADPAKALDGYDLTDEERALLEGLDEDNFDEFAGGLGGRSTKGSWAAGPG